MWKSHILDQALWKSTIRKKGSGLNFMDIVMDGVMYIVYAHRTCPWEMWSWSKWEIGLGEGTSHPLLLQGLWAGMRSRDTGLTNITFRLMNCRPQPTSAFLTLSPQMLRLRDPAALHYWTMAIMQDLINTHWFFLTSLYICWSWEVPKLIIFEGPTGDGITSISFPNTAGSLPCFRYALQQSIEKFWSLNSSWLLEACCSSTWSITTLCSTTGTKSTIGRRIQGCLKIVICRRI